MTNNITRKNYSKTISLAGNSEQNESFDDFEKISGKSIIAISTYCGKGGIVVRATDTSGSFRVQNTTTEAIEATVYGIYCYATII